MRDQLPENARLVKANNQWGMSAGKKCVNHVTLPVLARPVRQNPLIEVLLYCILKT